MPSFITSLASALKRFPFLQLLAVALGLFLALSLLASTRPWQDIELKGFDLLTTLSAPKRSTLPIVLVGIDDLSMAELRKSWPWPRSFHARLIDKLKEAGAAVIAIDVVFDFESSEAEDRALDQAIKRAGNVVLAAGMVKQETPYGTVWLRNDPLRRFVDNGATAGLVNLEFDRDQVMRRVPDNRDAFWRKIAAKLAAALPDVRFAAPPPPGAFIRYLGPAGTYPKISYYQALDPERYLPPGELAGSLVIVGRDTRAAADIGSAQVDTFATPFTTFGGELMAGGEIHANVLENALTGNSLRKAPAWLEYLLLAATSLLAALAMRRFHPVFSALAGIALMAMVAAIGWGAFVRAGTWIPAGISLLAVTLMYVSRSLLAFLAERQQRLAVKQIFSRYVPEEIVNELAAHPENLTLGGERREITVMFTDLANFTTLAEGMPPERAAEMLNRHLTEMNQIIFDHGGTIDKFIGDSIMAFWNAPLDNPGHALQGVRAACAMQSAMDKQRAELVADGFPPLEMRIGIHTGEALVGNMGSSIGRLSYTAIGDTVNLASRLEGANKVYGTNILVSATTAIKLAGEISLRQVDLLRVKGKHEAIEVMTPCADEQLIAASDAAVMAYRQRQWDLSTALWNEVLKQSPPDKLAPLYLARLDAFRQSPPAQDWDGSTTLSIK